MADLYPEHPYPINNLAAYYSGKEDWPKALGYLEKARALAPMDVLINLNLGFVQSQLGENDKARVYYEQVLASDAAQAVLDEARARLANLK